MDEIPVRAKPQVRQQLSNSSFRPHTSRNLVSSAIKNSSFGVRPSQQDVASQQQKETDRKERELKVNKLKFTDVLVVDALNALEIEDSEEQKEDEILETDIGDGYPKRERRRKTIKIFQEELGQLNKKIQNEK